MKSAPHQQKILQNFLWKVPFTLRFLDLFQTRQLRLSLLILPIIVLIHVNVGRQVG